MATTPESYIVFIRDRVDEDTRNAAANSSAVVCLAAPGVPVLYVSDVFEAHTGYAPSEIIGRSLSMLQGPATEPAAVAQFRELIENAKPGLVKITNYRKDGTPFTHECALRPISDASGTLTHFVAIQKPILP